MGSAVAEPKTPAEPERVNVSQHVNVNQRERVASALLGAVLVARGLSRRSLSGAAMMAVGGGLLARGVSGHSRVYGALDLSTTRGLVPRPAPGAGATTIQRSITIGRPADELYHLWRDPSTAGRILGHFAEVTPAGDERTHWSIGGPMGHTLEWDSQLVEDRPGELLRWESLAGAPMPIEISVQFRPAPLDWGTELTLQFHIDPATTATGTLVRAAANLLTRLEQALLAKALHRFKALAETGEIPTLERQPAAREGGRDS